MPKILIIDDEQQLRRVIELHLAKEGNKVVTCANGQEGLRRIEDENFDLIVTDLQMPKMGGIELLEALRESGNETPIMIMTAFGSVETAVEAMKLGAADYLTKPLQLAEISIKVDKILSRRELVEENKRLRRELAGKFQLGKIVGKSDVMVRLIEKIKPLAFDGNISVLLIGESGTGKELIANAIHYNSPRVVHPFVAVNCGAFPEQLLESELFGHEKGAFTDAKTTKPGLFEVANNGTLFLDEISSMPLSMQAKLLRAIEDRKIRRVGGTDEIEIDVRFIAASNQDLETLAKDGKFRQDLYYRLAVATIKLPPLRDREGDIRLLTQHFLEKFCREKGRSITIDQEVFKRFEGCSWEGNVRELENLIELLVVTNPGNHVRVSGLPESFGGGSKMIDGSFSESDLNGNLKSASRNFEKVFIEKRLEKNEGNVSKTAREIGISRSALHAKIRDMKIG